MHSDSSLSIATHACSPVAAVVHSAHFVPQFTFCCPEHSLHVALCSMVCILCYIYHLDLFDLSYQAFEFYNVLSKTCSVHRLAARTTVHSFEDSKAPKQLSFRMAEQLVFLVARLMETPTSFSTRRLIHHAPRLRFRLAAHREQKREPQPLFHLFRFLHIHHNSFAHPTIPIIDDTYMPGLSRTASVTLIPGQHILSLRRRPPNLPSCSRHFSLRTSRIVQQPPQLFPLRTAVQEKPMRMLTFAGKPSLKRDIASRYEVVPWRFAVLQPDL